MIKYLHFNAFNGMIKAIIPSELNLFFYVKNSAEKFFRALIYR